VKSSIRNSAFRIAGIYAAVSFTWIAFSDRIAVEFAVDYIHLSWFQTLKGFFFVATTTLLLFFFSKRQFERLMASHGEREREARAALLEKETLLREINHRVKNNLQVIVSLINLQGKNQDSFTDLGQKVRSMALAHDLLTSSPDMSFIEASRYANSLAEALGAAGDHSSLELQGEGDGTSLSADVAVSIGILIAEACSNTARHARRPDGTPASASISIRRKDDSLVVQVRDDGQGYPDRQNDGAAPECEGIGLALMEAIAAQVHGRLTRSNSNGAVVELLIPMNAEPAAALK